MWRGPVAVEPRPCGTERCLRAARGADAAPRAGALRTGSAPATVCHCATPPAGGAERPGKRERAAGGRHRAARTSPAGAPTHERAGSQRDTSEPRQQSRGRPTLRRRASPVGAPYTRARRQPAPHERAATAEPPAADTAPAHESGRRHYTRTSQQPARHERADSRHDRRRACVWRASCAHHRRLRSSARCVGASLERPHVTLIFAASSQ
jgi:hypothetical protein